MRLSWLGIILPNERSPVQFPVGADVWVASSVPLRVRTRGDQSMLLSHIDISLSLFLPLSKNKYIKSFFLKKERALFYFYVTCMFVLIYVEQHN